MIKSHESNEETEESKDSSETPQKEEKRRRSPTPPPARNSPEPSCAICLETLQNKSFTDSCFHMFCFTCLVEWSKVKAECPLCKKSFKSIVHNVRSFKDYDQYYITKSKLSENIWELSTERSFRYTTTLTSDRFLERRQIESEIASHRMRYAPHAVHHTLRMIPSAISVRRIPSPFRQRVYQENLWVKPIPSTRIRCISPAFFRANIACTHRLLPWLNRELPVVMSSNETQISFMIDLIMALIVKYEITSHEFYSLIEPYTRSLTAHFVHEFYNFAISPYETMDVYDLHAQYSTLPFDSVEDEPSPDSDVIPLGTSESSSQMSTSSDSTKKKYLAKKKAWKESKKLKKIILKRNTENNCWETIMPSVPFGGYGIPYEHPGPSTSRTKSVIEHTMEASRAEIDDCPTVVDDDECQVVDVLKPRHERTPEIVDLSSDDEKTIIDVPNADDNDSNNASVTTLNDIFDDDDIIFISEVKASSEVPDTPIDYSLKASRSTEESESKAETKPNCVCPKSVVPCPSDPSKSQILQSTVRDFSPDELSSLSPIRSLSPIIKRKKRKASLLDRISSDSCSEDSQASERETPVKKLKLKSVVAHFSYEPDSSHHSSSSHKESRKKHKDKKKKKKKHKEHKEKHNRKRRILSSDSDH